MLLLAQVLDHNLSIQPEALGLLQAKAQVLGLGLYCLQLLGVKDDLLGQLLDLHLLLQVDALLEQLLDALVSEVQGLLVLQHGLDDVVRVVGSGLQVLQVGA